ncbi:plastocyanin/azurin family copper-binding protein [Halobacteria archaeon AArc-dxtr1]|nr:plastocyanin/azurin family copper-binding protein [Halobacteria archaeon AArc-dxtr1]
MTPRECSRIGSERTVTRRTMLAGTTLVALGSLAGCLDDDENGDDDGNGNGNGNGNDDENGNGNENGNGDQNDNGDENDDENGDENGNDNGDENGDEEELFEIDPGTTIEFDGITSGWIGIEPDEIAGVSNPTLVLEEGEVYEIGWSMGDGTFHNIAIRDEEAQIVDNLRTPEVSDPGEDQWLEFEASEEMAQYVCEPHSGLMVGEIVVE